MGDRTADDRAKSVMSPPHAPEYDAVESWLVDWMDEQEVPGVAVSIDDGADRFVDGYGDRGPNTDDPVTGTTLFCLGSCTKAVTAAAVVKLAERDRLSLADEVERYVPLAADTAGPAITIEELLSHSSGVPSDDISGPLLVDPLLDGANDGCLEQTAFERHISRGLDRRLPDRDRFMYYNAGYSLLGRVIEAASGTGYAAFVDAEILSPLGMDRSAFRREAVTARSNRVATVVETDDGFVEREFPFDRYLHPSGGLFSSVDEFSRFVRAISAHSASDAAILTDESVQELRTPRTRFGRHFDDTPVEYGLGVMREPFLGGTLVHHGGTVGVSSAWFGVLQPADVRVVLCCGTEPETDLRAAGKGVLSILLGECPGERVHRLELDRALSSVAGTYESDHGYVTATVEPLDGGLTLRIDDRELPLVPQRLDRDAVFSTVDDSGYRRDVRFERSTAGTELIFERHRLSKVSDTSE